jgi:hypothetical protein
MLRKHTFFILCITISLFLFSCSGGAGDIPTSPADDRAPAAAARSHMLWGLYQFTADPVNETLEITPVRTAEFHLNALPFLEPPPFVYLSLESLQFNGDIITAGIGLRHPFLGLTEFTGFDVSGIFITDGSHAGFADSSIRYAGPGDTYLMNPDGHSRWWNPAEFPHAAGMLGYQDGLLGTPDGIADYNATINGYKYFCDDLQHPDDPLTEVTLERRGMFSAGKKNVRNYVIKLGAEGLTFNYAVEACWEFPQGNYPWTAPDDFGENANRTEPWFIKVTELANSLYYYNNAGGGGLSLSIDVYDWFDAELNDLYIEAANGVAPQLGPIAPTGGGDGYSTYAVDIIDASPTTSGDLDFLITLVTEAGDFEGFIPGTNTSGYLVYTAAVSNEPAGELEVTGIYPAYGKPDYTVDDAEVYGSGFVGGASLGVRLKKAGEPDIAGYNVSVQDENTIICDFDISTAAAIGLWDVRVTNGSGGVATGLELFEIFDCGEMTPIYISRHFENGGSSGWHALTVNWRAGLAITRLGPPYLIGRKRYPDDGTWIDVVNGLRARKETGGDINFDYKIDFATDVNPTSNITADTQNMLYFVLNTDYAKLLQIPFDPDTGFGAHSDFASIGGGYIIFLHALDEDDNPVVLGRIVNDPPPHDYRIFHWNGAGWDEVDVPQYIHEDGDIIDFLYNPLLQHYVFACRVDDGTGYFVSDLHAMRRNGQIVHSELDIFADFNHDQPYSPWMCIDPDNPYCRLVVWGGFQPTGFPTQDGYRPVIRYDALYGNKTMGHSSYGAYDAPWGKGAYAPGTDILYTGNSIWTIFTNWFELPPDW